MSNMNGIFRLIYGETQEEIKLSKEVTLGSQKEILGLQAKANQKLDKAIQEMRVVMKKMTDVAAMYRGANIEYNKSLESLKELKGQADKLGLEMPERLNGVEKQILKNMNIADEVIKGIQVARSNIQ